MEKYKLSATDMEVLSGLAKLELFQSSFYYRCAAVANNMGYLKAEAYFMNEAQEERSHFEMHMDYILGKGNDFTIMDIPGSMFSAEDLYGITEKAKEMEGNVTVAYEEAMNKVSNETKNHLLKFMTIQTEAFKFYTDACASLDGLTKSEQKLHEKQVYKL